MGTKLIENPQLNIFTGKQCPPAPAWYDDGLTVKERVSVDAIMAYLERHDANPQYFAGIAEPGYVDGPAIRADWNEISGQFQEWLEETMDIELLWNDEWEECDHCQAAVRVSASSYGWTPYFIRFDDCSLTCLDCVCSNWEEWKDDVIELYAEEAGYPPPQSKALPDDLVKYLSDEGYVCLDDKESEACQIFESGFHPGQNDTPEKVHELVAAEFPGSKIIFTLGGVSQFDMTFGVWLKYDKEVTK